MKFGQNLASITEILTDTFGITFFRATTDQKLALIECVAFLMRQSHFSLKAAISVLNPEVTMPPAVSACNLKLETMGEGLTLLALLYGGINRDCSGGISED